MHNTHAIARRFGHAPATMSQATRLLNELYGERFGWGDAWEAVTLTNMAVSLGIEEPLVTWLVGQSTSKP